MAKKISPAQALRISELRHQGLGYKAISLALGVDRDTIRNYCRAHELGGFATTIKKAPRSPTPCCAQCGKPIPLASSKHKRKFCSDTCRWKWWNSNSDEYLRPGGRRKEIRCLYCGKDFMAYSSKERRYCSHECYIRDRFWRMEDGREPYIPPSKQNLSVESI